MLHIPFEGLNLKSSQAEHFRLESCFVSLPSWYYNLHLWENKSCSELCCLVCFEIRLHWFNLDCCSSLAACRRSSFYFTLLPKISTFFWKYKIKILCCLTSQLGNKYRIVLLRRYTGIRIVKILCLNAWDLPTICLWYAWVITEILLRFFLDFPKNW